MRLIDANKLKRRAQKVATEAWKMKTTASVETILNQFIDWIDEAETIETTQGWTPCSERLPNKQTEVLVTDFGDVWTAYINTIGEWMDYDGNKLKDVTAWMPLPQPYKWKE